MIKRLLCDIILLISFIFWPWYITAILAVAFVLVLRGFWEIILLGYFMDSHYALPGAPLFKGFGVFSLAGLLLFIFSSSFRKILRL